MAENIRRMLGWGRPQWQRRKEVRHCRATSDDAQLCSIHLTGDHLPYPLDFLKPPHYLSASLRPHIQVIFTIQFAGSSRKKHVHLEMLPIISDVRYLVISVYKQSALMYSSYTVIAASVLNLYSSIYTVVAAQTVCEYWTDECKYPCCARLLFLGSHWSKRLDWISEAGHVTLMLKCPMSKG